MATGLDRFERLFSSSYRRKSSTVSSDSESQDPSKTTEHVVPLFPSPSFIRPRSNRMTAREEVLVTPAHHASRRAQSLPNPQMPHCTASTQRPIHQRQLSHHLHPQSFLIQGQHSQGLKPGSASTLQLHRAPVRSASLVNRKREVAALGLQSFQFPIQANSNGETSLGSMSSSIKSCKHHTGNGSSRSGSPPDSPVAAPLRSCLRTLTPCAELDASLQVQRSDFRLKPHSPLTTKPIPRLHPHPLHQLPTPRPSPELPPIIDASLSVALSLVPESNIDSAFVRPPCSILCPPSPSPSLKEPPVTDFLSLSDDDIAEIRPSTPVSLPCCPNTPLTPPSTISTASPSSSRTASVLTLPPPYSNQHPAAAAAAFEAARIAGRHNFDLVYVLNLWPEERPRKRSDKSKTDGSDHCMTGRILAAYGLSDIGSPFQISAAVHAKILKSEGWIEYRSQTLQADEFACGYARAFYPGQYARSGAAGPAPGCDVMEPCPRELIDRGILFAAYRKPGKHAQDAGCSPSELADLYRSVETLIEMLIDMHVAEGLQQPANRAFHLDVTGPLPVQRRNIFV